MLVERLLSRYAISMAEIAAAAVCVLRRVFVGVGSAGGENASRVIG